MARIVDTVHNAGPAAGCLRQAGVETVIRYYSEFPRLPDQRLAPDEAAALAAAGLRLCAVYRDAHDRRDHFSRPEGLARGAYAYRYARDIIGQSPGSAIYFAVAFDADEQDLDEAVVPFFEGLNVAFKQESGGRPDFRIGVYGSGLVCRRLIDEGRAALAWLARSRGWRETQSFEPSGAWRIKQIEDSELCGLRIGINETNPANAEFGAFEPSAKLLPPAVPDAKRLPGGVPHHVIARHGLRLRAGPSTSFDVVAVLPFGTQAFVLERDGAWAKIDLEGDGKVDGFAHTGFLEPLG